MWLREVVALVVVAVSGGGAHGAEPLTLAEAVHRALAQNEEVVAAEAEVRAAKGRLEGASVLLAANPELSGAAGTRDAAGSRTVDWEVAVSQRVELGGQRGARVAGARAALGAAEARLAATKARIAAEVRERLGRAAALRLRLEVASEARRLAELAETAAEKRFLAGDVARIEVNSARLERGSAGRAAIEVEQERLAALAALELLLAVEPGTLPELAFQLGGAEGVPQESVDELVRTALASRPDVVAARLDVSAAEAEARLAIRAVVPSPALGLSVAREESADVVQGTLSIELPLFARNQAERGVASARLEQARVALAALERRAAQEVRLASERLRASRRALQAFDAETTAALGENLALVTKAYEAGQLDFVRYQLLRGEALEARRERIDALEGLNRAEAQLERALGRALDGAVTGGRGG